MSSLINSFLLLSRSPARRTVFLTTAGPLDVALLQMDLFYCHGRSFAVPENDSCTLVSTNRFVFHFEISPVVSRHKPHPHFR